MGLTVKSASSPRRLRLLESAVPEIPLTVASILLACRKDSNMRFGINTFLFTSPFTNESTRLFPTFKKWGFQTLEIPVEELPHIDPAHASKELNNTRLSSRTTRAWH